MRMRLNYHVLAIMLSVGIFLATASKADELDKSGAITKEIDDFNASTQHACEEKAQQIAQEAAKEERVLASMSQSADPQARERVTEHVNAAKAAVERIHQLAEQPAPKTPEEKEARARALSEAFGYSTMVQRSLDRDLGVGRPDVIDHVVVDRNNLFTFCQGSPNCNVVFDGGNRRNSNWEVIKVGGPQPFGLGTPQRTITEYTPITIDQAKHVEEFYGSTPEGVVLEGIATGLGDIRRVRYDKAFNAFVLDERAVYFAKIPPWTLSLLCRAIGTDDNKHKREGIAGNGSERVGVSYGRIFLSYGKVPIDSALSQDLLLTDRFLADIVFASNHWTTGYKFEDGYVPQKREGDDSDVAVSFSFNRFEFQTRDEVIKLAQSGFDVKLYPISETPAEDGGGKPDYQAIAHGHTFPEFERNAMHVANQIDYYRRERIVERTFSYGETAAFIRGLKASRRVDLEKLANEIVGK